MTFNQAQDEFAVRFYLWANEEARLEVERGFPFLKRIDTVTCRRYLRRMTQLSTEDQFEWAALFVKRFNPHAMKLLGESLTSEEIGALKSYSDTVALELDPVEQAFLKRQLANDPTTKLNRKQFTKVLKSHLSPVLGQQDTSGGGGTWRYQNPVGSLRVDTYLDTGGNHHQLNYSHRIIFSGYESLNESISALSWLGLSSGTYWNDLEDSKAELTAGLVAELCAHFLNVAPKLLKGIQPN